MGCVQGQQNNSNYHNVLIKPNKLLIDEVK
jgi:hypothetical protein